jgi:energy-coupling factor transport system ATP-binding protein
MVSHDVEFCAEFADRCALFFDGNIVTENAPREFFSGNSFYTTAANRMARSVLPQAVTAGDVILALNGTIPQTPEILEYDAKYEIESPEPLLAPKNTKLSAKRKLSACAFGIIFLAAIVLAALRWDGFSRFLSGGNEAELAAAEGAWSYVGIMLALAMGIVGILLSLTYKSESAPPVLLARKLPKRTIAAALSILVLIPLTIYVGTYFFGDRKYYFVALLIILETMIPFALVFESRKPQARELVIIAVLTAIAVAGRAAFFMLPQFKPVLAIVIIAGVAFGGEAGFLVGALTGFVSNMFFGQGPWTPWQMFAFGIIGFLAGVLFRKRFLRRNSLSLAIFGAFAAVVIYGLIMDTSMVVIYQSNITRELLLAAFLQGVPFNLVHAAATVLFMLVIARPMLEKLDRIKTKYGLVE